MLPEGREISVVNDPGVFILYGPPKVGKTTLINTLENNLILDFEDGTKYLDSMSIRIIGIKTPKDEKAEIKAERLKNKQYYLAEVGAELKKSDKKYDFLTVDTVTEFEDMLGPIALEMYKATPMGSSFEGTDVLTLERGSGYYYLRLAFKKYIDSLSKLSDRLILIGHLKDNIVSKAGKEVNAKDLDLTGKIKQIACKDADAVGYLYRGADNELRINFKSSDELTCGSRCKHLKGMDIKIADYDVAKNDLTNIDWSLIYPDKCKK